MCVCVCVCMCVCWQRGGRIAKCTWEVDKKTDLSMSESNVCVCVCMCGFVPLQVHISRLFLKSSLSLELMFSPQQLFDPLHLHEKTRHPKSRTYTHTHTCAHVRARACVCVCVVCVCVCVCVNENNKMVPLPAWSGCSFCKRKNNAVGGRNELFASKGKGRGLRREGGKEGGARVWKDKEEMVFLLVFGFVWLRVFFCFFFVFNE